MLILRYLAKLLKALASEASPAQIAGGFILGMIIGLTPLSSFHNIIVLILILILRVNIGMAILSFMIFSGIAWLADNLFHGTGVWLLEMEGMQSVWTDLYNIEWVAMTRFYNTVVIGSLLWALILTVPVFFSVKAGVIQYREKIHSRVQKWKIVRVVKGSKFYSVYEKVNRLRG